MDNCHNYQAEWMGYLPIGEQKGQLGSRSKKNLNQEAFIFQIVKNTLSWIAFFLYITPLTKNPVFQLYDAKKRKKW